MFSMKLVFLNFSLFKNNWHVLNAGCVPDNGSEVCLYSCLQLPFEENALTSFCSALKTVLERLSGFQPLVVGPGFEHWSDFRAHSLNLFALLLLIKWNIASV